MALVTKLKEYRERDDLKQAELAELVGVRRETIVNLEKGKYNPSLKLAMDIAKVFHTTVKNCLRIQRIKKTQCRLRQGRNRHCVFAPQIRHKIHFSSAVFIFYLVRC